ncbi:hypothetical protein [Ralstonia pickettii]|uniref:Band 7 domain-containing protein n=1 Tax=Ralstonia pickettii TaxID=329 RepID=A0AAW4Q696_RALPI|nr:hypothetical protein [Ralstonia pickettii]MBX3755356.1 hypothetical protein [Ralstonia pickettii]MBX3784136.1 hypothetical protein [Ralstonia pickettii]MBX3789228.1 hypothetical protein [Ralstonia pickettii]MBX3793831.1 hypothetical protein [Ralstonia pickettii]MBX3876368.1 hypothetical protein [Ralstonia pickettii]
MLTPEKYSTRYFPERFRLVFPAESSRAAQMLRAAPIPMPTHDMFASLQRQIAETYNKDISKVPFEQRPARPTPVMGQVLSLAFAYGKFYVAGRQIYDVGPKMQAVLVGADYREVPVSMLMLPFSTVYLHFGPQKFTIKVAAFEGAIVSQYKGLFEIHLCTSQGPSYLNGGRFVYPAHYLYLTFDASEYPPDTPLGDVVADAVRKEKEELAKRSKEPAEQIALDGVVVADRRAQGAQEDLENYSIAIQNVDDAMRLVVNALIFVTAYKEHVATSWTSDTPSEIAAVAEGSNKPKARQDARQKLLADGYYKVNFVGSGFDFGGCGEESEASPEAGVRPHWRRAHWRIQRYGEGRQETKMVLIRQVLVNADKLGSDQQLPGRISTI